MKTQYQTILILWNKAMNLKDLFYIFSLEITNILTKQKELTFHHTSTFKICSSSFCIKIFITMWHCFIYNICIYIVLYIELVLYIKSHPTAEVQPERGRHFAVLTQAHGGLNFLPFHFCNYEKSVTVPVRGCQKAT